MPQKRASKKATTAACRGGDGRRNSMAGFDTDDEGYGRGDGEGEVNMVQELRAMEENLRQSAAFDAGIRKEQKQKRLEKEFDAHVSKLDERIDEKVDAYRETVKRNQDAYLNRLTTLLQRKAEVERQIVQHTRELTELCTTTTQEFEAVVKGRSDDVDEAIRDLLNAAADAEGDKQQAKDHSS